MRKIGEEVECFCNNCQKRTNHKILCIEYDPKVGGEEYLCEESYQIVKCCGCDNYEFRKEYVDFENDQYNYDEIYPKYALKIFSDRESACIPSNIYNLYSEIRRAVSSESMLLAGIGLRILVEAIANDLKIQKDKLQSKITEMKNRSLISDAQCSMLHKIRFLGNDVAHETELPTHDQVNMALDILETVIRQCYVQPELAKRRLPTTVNYEKFKQLALEKAEKVAIGTKQNISFLLPNERRDVEDFQEFAERFFNEIKMGEISSLVHIPTKPNLKPQKEIIQKR